MAVCLCDYSNVEQIHTHTHTHTHIHTHFTVSRHEQSHTHTRAHTEPYSITPLYAHACMTAVARAPLPAVLNVTPLRAWLMEREGHYK